MPTNISAAFASLAGGAGDRCATRNDGDPIVLYDTLAGRWLINPGSAGQPRDGTVVEHAEPCGYAAHFSQHGVGLVDELQQEEIVLALDDNRSICVPENKPLPGQRGVARAQHRERAHAHSGA